jgi:hypothetical protein
MSMVCPSCRRVVPRLTRNGRCRTCYERQRRARVRARHGNRQKRTCECCGTRLTSKRADALYCSSRCRQRAYRHRHAGPALSPPMAPARKRQHSGGEERWARPAKGYAES